MKPFYFTNCLETLTLSCLIYIGSAVLVDAYGSQITVDETNIQRLNICEEGSLVAFDRRIHVISPHSKFEITALGLSPTSDVKSDVKIVSVRPVVKNSTETVAFILENGSQIKVLFVEKSNCEKSYRITQAIDTTSESMQVSPGQNTEFLSEEINLMKAMISGKNLDVYSSKDIGITLPYQGNIDSDTTLKLVKEYRRGSVLGWKIQLKWNGSTTIDVVPLRLSKNSQMAPVLFHANPTQDPTCLKTKDSCTKILQLIFRSRTSFRPGSWKDFPFIINKSFEERR